MKANAWTRRADAALAAAPGRREGLGRGVPTTTEGSTGQRNGSSEARIGRPPPHPLIKLRWQREGQSDAASEAVPAVQGGNTTCILQVGVGEGAGAV